MKNNWRKPSLNPCLVTSKVFLKYFCFYLLIPVGTRILLYKQTTNNVMRKVEYECLRCNEKFTDWVEHWRVCPTCAKTFSYKWFAWRYKYIREPFSSWLMKTKLRTLILRICYGEFDSNFWYLLLCHWKMKNKWLYPGYYIQITCIRIHHASEGE